MLREFVEKVEFSGVNASDYIKITITSISCVFCIFEQDHMPKMVKIF